jgi:CheY-like chemotaxis protein
MPERHKILVVDDDTETTRIFEIALDRLGYDPTIASNVPQARAYLEDNTPHAVLLDIMLPGVIGLDLLTEIRSNSRLQHIYVVIISAHEVDWDLVPEGVAPNDILRKPVRVPDLRHLLGQALA